MSSVLELQSGGQMGATTGLFPASFGLTFGMDGSEEKEKPVLRLREPRDLYSTTSLQHPPKWPIECQVIAETIRHIETAPAKLESFYIPTNTEPQPKPVGEDMGSILYDYQPKLSVDYFCRSCVGGSDALEFFEHEPNSLRFESRFESGNLAKAIKITNVYYELYLRQDLYTDRHSQWFYFRIQNMKDNVQYRFSIVNFTKPDSLYRYGLKLLMYSEKEAQLNKVGWTRCGQNISYYKNDIPSDDNGSLYTLTFNLKFKHANDTIYLAHCYPYTYTRLQTYLRTLEDDELKSDMLTVRLLCRSLAGNNVYVVTVTSPDNYNDENQKKPAVVISARVHPGESQSSFMMEGIIDFLTSNSPQAKELRDRFIFKLIPMLNPDGVIVGNSRCCLLGQDLNRQYRTVLREAFPQIYQTKVLLRRLAETNGIFLYCDIHGHSRRNNVFIYGCENRKFPEKKLIEQVFPLMMYKNSTDKFSFQNCKFRVQKNKEGTGRVFAWTLGVVHSYTLEISLGGSTMPSRPGTHFNTADYEAMGRHFCETLLDYSDPSLEKEALREKILQRLSDIGSNADEPMTVYVTDYSSLSHSDSEESNEEVRKVRPMSLSLKRQSSVRISKKRIHPESESSNVTTTIATTNSSTTSQTTVSTPSLKNEPSRSLLCMNKASVNSIRITAKTPTKVAGEDFVVQKELALFKRLTKFRRKTRRNDAPNFGSFQFQSSQIDRELYRKGTALSTTSTKYTSVLFDDPFNPPGTISSNDRRLQRLEVTEGMYTVTDDESGSGTEDECDEKDSTIKNSTFAAQNASEGISPTGDEDVLNCLRQLKISAGNTTKDALLKTSYTSLLPNTPRPRSSVRKLSSVDINKMPFTWKPPEIIVSKTTDGKKKTTALSSTKKKSLDEESLQAKTKGFMAQLGTRRRASLATSTLLVPSSSSTPSKKLLYSSKLISPASKLTHVVKPSSQSKKPTAFGKRKGSGSSSNINDKSGSESLLQNNSQKSNSKFKHGKSKKPD